MGYDKSTFRIFSGKLKYFFRASGSIQHPCIDSQPFPLFQHTEILFFILFIFFSYSFPEINKRCSHPGAWTGLSQKNGSGTAPPKNSMPYQSGSGCFFSENPGYPGSPFLRLSLSESEEIQRSYEKTFFLMFPYSLFLYFCHLFGQQTVMIPIKNTLFGSPLFLNGQTRRFVQKCNTLFFCRNF